MALFSTMLLEMAVGVFLVLLFAEYADVREKAEKGFNLLAGSGLFFLLAGTFNSLGVWEKAVGATTAGYGVWLFEIIGWVFVVIGTVWAAYQLARK